MKKNEKRSISILTVLLWITLISVMTVITINGININDAIEDEGEIAKDVGLSKNAEWVDKEKGIAKVTLKVSGDMQAVGQSDVLLIVDKSGSMTFRSDFINSGLYYEADGVTKFEKDLDTSIINKPGTEEGYSLCTNLNHWINGKHYYDVTNVIENQEQDLYDKMQGCTDRFDITIKAINKFLDIYLDPKYNNRVAYMSFAGNTNDNCNYGTFTNDKTKISNDDPENLGILQITQKNLASETHYKDAFMKACDDIIAPKNLSETSSRFYGNNPTYVIFFTDGNPWPEIYQNGVGAIVNGYSTPNAIHKTDEIFAIGLGVDDDKYLSKVATNENDLYLIQEANELVPLFEELSEKLLSAGTDAYITDVISEDFEYYEDETHKPTEGTILLPPDSEDGSYKLEEKESYWAEEGEKVVANVKAYETYTFNKEAKGTVLEGVIEETGRTVLKLYYDKIKSKVVVRYVDRKGIDIADKIELTGKVGEEYKTERKEIEGYVAYGEDPENALGLYKEKGEEVIYVYDKVVGKVIVEYVDKEGKDIANIEILEGKVGEEYVTKRKEIEGYIAYGEEPENKVGKYINGEIIVRYVYDKEEVNTGDINIEIYVVVSLIAIVGVVVGIFIIKSNSKIKMSSKKNK